MAGRVRAPSLAGTTESMCEVPELGGLPVFRSGRAQDVPTRLSAWPTHAGRVEAFPPGAAGRCSPEPTWKRCSHGHWGALRACGGDFPWGLLGGVVLGPPGSDVYRGTGVL